jgi:hypothetical protein
MIYYVKKRNKIVETFIKEHELLFLLVYYYGNRWARHFRYTSVAFISAYKKSKILHRNMAEWIFKTRIYFME